VKRLNASDAFTDEPLSEQGRSRVGVGDEAVVLAVRGGQIAAAVPAETDADRAIDVAGLIRGVLRLENEQVLTFQIRRASGYASFRHEAAHLEQHLPAVDAGAPLAPDASTRSQTAEQIMTRQVLTTSPDLLVEDVAKMLAYHNISGMPVEDWDGKVIGIVSEADVIGKIGHTIRDVMSDQVISVSRSTPVEQIATLLAERRIKRVPVLVDEMLVGIVSRADIVRAFAERS
jgi:CBS domain-containing protein